MRWVRPVLVANGVYDLACALSILYRPQDAGVIHTLSGLHLGMYTTPVYHLNPALTRMLAYWILTYGLVRAACGWWENDIGSLRKLGAMTYFIEAACLLHEYWTGGTMIASKVTFVCGVCVVMGFGMIT